MSEYLVFLGKVCPWPWHLDERVSCIELEDVESICYVEMQY